MDLREETQLSYWRDLRGSLGGSKRRSLSFAGDKSFHLSQRKKSLPELIIAAANLAKSIFDSFEFILSQPIPCNRPQQRRCSCLTHTHTHRQADTGTCGCVFNDLFPHFPTKSHRLRETKRTDHKFVYCLFIKKDAAAQLRWSPLISYHYLLQCPRETP